MKIILRLCVSTLAVALAVLLLMFGRAYFAANSTLGETVDQAVDLCFLLLMLASLWLYLRCWLGLFFHALKELFALLLHKKTPAQLLTEQEDADILPLRQETIPLGPRDREPFDYEAAPETAQPAAIQPEAAPAAAAPSAEERRIDAPLPEEAAAERFAPDLLEEKEMTEVPWHSAEPWDSAKPWDSAEEAPSVSELPEPPEDKPSRSAAPSAASHGKKQKAGQPAAQTVEEKPKQPAPALFDLSDEKSARSGKDKTDPRHFVTEITRKAAELAFAEETEEQYIARELVEVFGRDDPEEDIFANRDGDVWVRSK